MSEQERLIQHLTQASAEITNALHALIDMEDWPEQFDQWHDRMKDARGLLDAIKSQVEATKTN